RRNMDQSELKYAIRVDEKALFIRFYTWLWQADSSKINFCKLFWGYMFAAPALAFRSFLVLGKLTVLTVKFAFLALIFALTPLTWAGAEIGSYTGARRKARAEKKAIKRFEFEGWLATEKKKEKAAQQWKEANEAQAKEREEARKAKADSMPVMQRGLENIEHAGILSTLKVKEKAESAKDVGRKGREIIGFCAAAVGRPIGKLVSSPAFGKSMIGLAAGASALMVLAGLYVGGPTAVHALGTAGKTTIGAVGTVGAATAGVVGAATVGAVKGVGTVASAVPAGAGYVAKGVTSPAAWYTALGFIALAILCCIVMAAIAIRVPALLYKPAITPAAYRVERGANVLGKGGQLGGRVLEKGFKG